MELDWPHSQKIQQIQPNKHWTITHKEIEDKEGQQSTADAPNYKVLIKWGSPGQNCDQCFLKFSVFWFLVQRCVPLFSLAGLSGLLSGCLNRQFCSLFPGCKVREISKRTSPRRSFPTAQQTEGEYQQR